MTTKLEEGDEILTISDDGKTAETKKPPEEKKVAKESDEDDADEHEEDERHAAGTNESAEDADARKAARREARRSRKTHRREREAAKDAELESLRGRLAAVEGQVTTVAQTSTTQTLAIVDQRLSEARQAKELADAALEAAITKQDGKGAREAIKARDAASEAERLLNNYRTNYEATAKNQPQRQEQVNPVLMNYAKRFRDDNPWVNLNPGDDDADSQKVMRLDASVKSAGYDPTTPEYWEELQDRVDRAFPAKLADMDEEPAARAAPQRQAAGTRRGPAMSGGRSSAPLGKNDVIVPKALREAAGKDWDNPVERADIIKRYKASVEKYGARK